MASSFAEAVWELVRGVPPGRVTTYGQLAEAHYGMRKGAQGVGQALAHAPEGVPWWRVVQADGSTKAPRGADEQRARLLEEGVELTLDGRVDWRRARPWSPPQPGAPAAGPWSPPPEVPAAGPRRRR
jgi:methylated-DNA-protein-cysteine methyltransferase-like protein